MRAALLFCSMVACVMGAAIALAQEDTREDPWALALEGPPACLAQFEPELLKKTRRVVVDARTDTKRLRVRVREDAGGFTGTLDIEGPSPSTRSLSSASCAEVVRGLALVAALTIDPPVVTVVTAPVSDGGSGDADANVTIDAPSPAPPPAPSDDASTEQNPSFAGSAGPVAEVSSLAGALVSLGLMGELELRRPSAFSPSVRLQASTTLPATETGRSGDVELSWTTGSLEACPLRWGIVDDAPFRFAVRPCGGVDLGVLRARGIGPQLMAAEEPSLFWAAGRLSLRSLLEPPGPLAVELSGGALAPLTRDDLVLRSTTGLAEPLYRASTLAVFGSAALLVRFR